MEISTGVISEAVILFFYILFSRELTVPKWNHWTVRIVTLFVGVLMVGAFYQITISGILSEISSAMICVVVPSFLLFFIFSKYKDFRFFVTFCFLNTVTLVLTFFSRVHEFSLGNEAGVISAATVCIFAALLYFVGRPAFKRYRELLESVQDGWGAMAISALFIYILLIFVAVFPKPLQERSEFFLVYALLCVTGLSVFAAFIVSVYQRKKLIEINLQITKESRWHKLAYNDVLTGLKNRMAYVERVGALNRTGKPGSELYAVMIDIDHFKQINDNFGHHTGDLILKLSATVILGIFDGPEYEIFRIGGDEFVIFAEVSESVLQEKLQKLHEVKFDSEVPSTFSVGYSAICFGQNNAVESAIVRADTAMYQEKMKKTETVPGV